MKNIVSTCDVIDALLYFIYHHKFTIKDLALRKLESLCPKHEKKNLKKLLQEDFIQINEYILLGQKIPLIMMTQKGYQYIGEPYRKKIVNGAQIIHQ